MIQVDMVIDVVVLIAVAVVVVTWSLAKLRCLDEGIGIHCGVQ